MTMKVFLSRDFAAHDFEKLGLLHCARGSVEGDEGCAEAGGV